MGLVRDLEVSTASVHCSRAELSQPGEVVYRDKGYFGVKPRGYHATMRRATRGRPLGIWDRLRNRRINGKRAPGGKTLRSHKTSVQHGACAGDHSAAGQGEDGIRLLMLQTPPAEHTQRRLTA